MIEKELDQDLEKKRISRDRKRKYLGAHSIHHVL